MTKTYILICYKCKKRKEFDHDKLVEKIKIGWGELSDKEKLILDYRFGVVNGKMLTYQQISTKFNVTNERVRQIEDEAIQKVSKFYEMREESS